MTIRVAVAAAGAMVVALTAAAALAAGKEEGGDVRPAALAQEHPVAGVLQVCGDLARIADGTVYCLEEGHARVFRIRRNGAVEKVYDGEEHSGSSGSAFVFQSIAVANDGTLYGSARKDNVVVRVAAHGRKLVVYAGGFGVAGAADGAGMAARFNAPGGIVVDDDKRLWVADSRNHTIRVIDRKGRVTTVAGAAGQPGRTDGEGVHARFDRPERLALGADGSVIVLEAGGASVRRIDPSTFRVGTVAEFRGEACAPGECCKTGCNVVAAAAAVDKTGTVYLADRRGRTYYRIEADGQAVRVGGKAPFAGGAPATGASVRSLVYGWGDTLYAGRSDGLVKLEMPSARSR